MAGCSSVPPSIATPKRAHHVQAVADVRIVTEILASRPSPGPPRACPPRSSGSLCATERSAYLGLRAGDSHIHDNGLSGVRKLTS